MNQLTRYKMTRSYDPRGDTRNELRHSVIQVVMAEDARQKKELWSCQLPINSHQLYLLTTTSEKGLCILLQPISGGPLSHDCDWELLWKTFEFSDLLLIPLADYFEYFFWLRDGVLLKLINNPRQITYIHTCRNLNHKASILSFTTV